MSIAKVKIVNSASVHIHNAETKATQHNDSYTGTGIRTGSVMKPALKEEGCTFLVNLKHCKLS